VPRAGTSRGGTVVPAAEPDPGGAPAENRVSPMCPVSAVSHSQASDPPSPARRRRIRRPRHRRIGRSLVDGDRCGGDGAGAAPLALEPERREFPRPGAGHRPRPSRAGRVPPGAAQCAACQRQPGWHSCAGGRHLPRAYTGREPGVTDVPGADRPTTATPPGTTPSPPFHPPVALSTRATYADPRAVHSRSGGTTR